MAVIQRPVKTHGTRTYVAEVAAAPDNENPILANEVDLDLDSIYAAWNGGVDTVNIKDAAVTVPKLDPAIRGAAQGAFPGAVTLAPRMTLVPATTTADVYGNAIGSPNYDSTKPTWLIRQDYSTDVFQVWRLPPGTGQGWSILLSMDALGNVTYPGFTNHKARASGIYALTLLPIASGATGQLTLAGVWVNSGNLAGNSVLTAPAFDCWVMLYAVVTVDRNGGFGIALNIEEWNGSAWVPDASILPTAATTALTLNAFRPVSANRQFRVTLGNATGGTVTVQRAEFTIGVLGGS